MKFSEWYKKQIFIFVLLGLLFCSNVLNAQFLSGRVFDAKNDVPLSGVNVVVKNTPFGAVTDQSGEFLINGIRAGNYQIVISRVDFLSFEKEVIIPSAALMLYLQPAMVSLNNEVIISASRQYVNDFESSEAISVIRQKEIIESGSRTVPEALVGINGVFVQKTNHGGGSPFIRGLTGNQNLVVIDGIRLNNSTFRYGPVQYLNTIDPNTVSQIELLRGSGSVQYGSDALGGVIHVLTRDPSFSSKLHVNGSVQAKYLSNGMEKAGRAELEVHSKKIAFLGGFGYRDFGDLVAGNGIGKQNFTGYTEYSGDGKILVKIGKNEQLTFGYQYFEQNDVPRTDKLIIENGKDPEYQKYLFDPQIRELAFLKFSKTNICNLVKTLNITASYQLSDEKRILQKVNQSKITHQSDVVDTYGFTMEIASQPVNNWLVSTGFDVYNDEIESIASEENNGQITQKRGLYPDGSTSMSIGFFNHHQYEIKRLIFFGGFRLNQFNIKAEDAEFGNVKVDPLAIVGDLGITYKVSGNHHIIGSVNTGFRAPNINDLGSFGSFSYGIEVPNPDLKPEKSISYELGWKSKYEKLSTSIYIFHTNFTDFIDRVKGDYQGDTLYDSTRVYFKENVLDAYLQGVEFMGEYHPLNALTIIGSVGYTYGQNKSKDEPMSKIPPANGRLAIKYQINKVWWCQVEWIGAEKQDRLSAGDKSDSRIPKEGTPGWSVINIRSGYTWKWFQINGGLNNLLNKAYRYHGSGVDGIGQSVWLSVRYKF